MTRGSMLAIAVGGLVFSGTPYVAANAQSGDALARAERTCLDNGVRPSSNAYNSCVNRVADAFWQGAPDVADDTARSMGVASRRCLSYGIDPQSLGYSQCVDNETYRRGASLGEPPLDAPPNAPHVAIGYTAEGYGYDRYGNLLDRYGYVIHPPSETPYR
jgi:hypothetical protein